MSQSTSVALPSKADDVDAKWLTAALQKGQLLDLDEIITSFEMKKIGMEQGFTCSLFAIQLTTNKANQKSVVMKITDKPEMMAGVFANELDFYERNKSHTPASISPCKRCEKRGGICTDRDSQTNATSRIPNTYWSGIKDDGSAFALVMEDLVASSFQSTDQVVGMDLEATRASLRWVARFHARWWHTHPQYTTSHDNYDNDDNANNKPAVEPLFKWSGSEVQKISLMVTNAMWPKARASMLARHTKVTEGFGFDALPHTDTVSLLDDLISRWKESLGGVRSEQPTTLVHGDFRPDNILISVTAGCCAVDYQTTRYDRPTADISYFMASLPISLRRQNQATLLREYHDELVQHCGVVYSWEDFMDDFHRDLLSNLTITCLHGARLETARAQQQQQQKQPQPQPQQPTRTDALTTAWFDRIITCLADNDPRPTLNRDKCETLALADFNKYIASFNAEDLQGVTDCLDEDVKVWVGNQMLGDGRAAILPSYSSDFALGKQVLVSRKPTVKCNALDNVVVVDVGLQATNSDSSVVTLDVRYTYNATTMKQVRHDISNVVNTTPSS